MKWWLSSSAVVHPRFAVKNREHSSGCWTANVTSARLTKVVPPKIIGFLSTIGENGFVIYSAFLNL